MNPLRSIALVGALLAVSSDFETIDGGDGGRPRRDRHGRHQRVDPDQFNTAKKKSSSLEKLLRK